MSLIQRPKLKSENPELAEKLYLEEIVKYKQAQGVVVRGLDSLKPCVDSCIDTYEKESIAIMVKLAEGQDDSEPPDSTSSEAVLQRKKAFLEKLRLIGETHRDLLDLKSSSAKMEDLTVMQTAITLAELKQYWNNIDHDPSLQYVSDKLSTAHGVSDQNYKNYLKDYRKVINGLEIRMGTNEETGRSNHGSGSIRRGIEAALTFLSDPISPSANWMIKTADELSNILLTLEEDVSE